MKRLEFKIGLFALFGGTILLLMVIFFGNFNFFEKGYDVRVRFSFTNGVKMGAPVRFSGVEIGFVKDIVLLEDGTSVELVLWIKKGTVVRQNVKVYVNTLGVMGEKYIEFLGGTPSVPILTEKSLPLKGIDPIAINEMAGLGKSLANQMNSLVLKIQQIVGDEQTKKDFKETISNTKKLTYNLNEFIIELRAFLKKDGDNISQVLRNIKISSAKLKDTLDIAGNILEKVNNGEGSLGKFIKEEDLYKNLEELSLDIKNHPWKLLSKPRRTRTRRSQKK